VIYDYERLALGTIEAERWTMPEKAPRNFVIYGAADVDRPGLSPD
jgi:hypothetical protein